MYPVRVLLLVFALTLGGLAGCKKDDNSTPQPTAATQTDLLVASNWQLSRVTTTDGQTIGPTRLDAVTRTLFDMNMQFRADNTVRAIDRASKQILNGGTWQLTPDSQSMNVVVTGFSGNFPIVQLSRSKLILRQNQKAKVDGNLADIQLEFTAL